MSIPAFTNDAVFRAFLDQVLLPELRPGQVVVLDNLPAHEQSAVERSIRAAGCRPLFLPRYGPEFDPIEPCWSKLKNHLRSMAARSLESLQGALLDGMNHITDSDARGWFRYAGHSSALH